MKNKMRYSLVIVFVLIIACMGVAFAQYADFGDYPTKRLNDQDNYVRALQTVVKYNYSSSLANDGIFGANTETAIESWQAANGLTADGVVGRNTWNKMCDKLDYRYVGYYEYACHIIQPSGIPTTLPFIKFKKDGPTGTEQDYVYKARVGSGTNDGTWYQIQ